MYWPLLWPVYNHVKENASCTFGHRKRRSIFSVIVFTILIREKNLFMTFDESIPFTQTFYCLDLLNIPMKQINTGLLVFRNLFETLKDSNDILTRQYQSISIFSQTYLSCFLSCPSKQQYPLFRVYFSFLYSQHRVIYYLLHTTTYCWTVQIWLFWKYFITVKIF